MWSSYYWILFSALLPAVAGQWTPWPEGQINTTMCVWDQLRAVQIRDTIYMDGGSIIWSPGMADGSLGPPTDTGNIKGLIFKYNLTTPFDSTTNVSDILVTDTLSKARGGSGNNVNEPPFHDGTMLANDAQFYMYGGLTMSIRGVYEDPAIDEVLGYEVHQYGPDRPVWNPGFHTGRLGKDVHRYIAYGAGVSAPSENKAWYFGGMVARSGGSIEWPGIVNRTTTPQVVSNTLIQVDMTDQRGEVWTNKTLPSDIEGRANPSAVWVPVGKEGILVILGGILYPEWITVARRSDNKEASKKESPKFIQEIDIYDIAQDKWYKQPTQGGPSARTRGCAVLATASDDSSFNIYYYGGWDGLAIQDEFYDDVWVLSMPSFTWTQLNKGTPIHGRTAHKCFTPYPDQMMVIGGITPRPGRGIDCLDKGPIVMFNLTTGEWMDSYHPDKYAPYGVPTAVQDKIGGDASGGATVTTPVPSGWATPDLSDVFQQPYDKKKLKTWGPYSVVDPNTGRRNDLLDENPSGATSGSLPSWVPPVLGIILGLMLVTGFIVAFYLWKRRNALKNSRRGGGYSEAGTEDAGKRILSWMNRGQGGTEKVATYTTADDVTPVSPELSHVVPISAVSPAEQLAASTSAASPPCHEAGSTEIAELGDTSPPAELSDTGMSPIDIINKHSRFANNNNPAWSSHSPSNMSGGASTIAGKAQSTASGSTNVVNFKDECSPGGRSSLVSPEPPMSAAAITPGGLSSRRSGNMRKSVFREHDDDEDAPLSAASKM